MKKQTAIFIMFLILGVLLIFHLLILTRMIPYDQVWAGKLDSVEEMRKFESFAILINLAILITLVVKYRLLQAQKRNRFIDILIWGFATFFMLNTVGNLFTESIWELLLGGAVTMISAVLCVVIARKEKGEYKDVRVYLFNKLN